MLAKELISRQTEGLAATLTKNISYLSLAQIANYVLPLAVIPYITRTVGPSNYGLVEFATVVLLYFIVIADYSFNVTATRRIAANISDKQEVSQIFSAVMGAKGLLFGVSLVIFGILVTVIPTFREKALLLWMAFPIVLGWALYPNFLFQGTQRLGVVALANVLIKGSSAAFIFIFLKEAEDYRLVPFINGITQVGVGVLTLIYAMRKLPEAQWLRPGWQAMASEIREGRFVFLSNYFTRIYGFSAIFIGGFLLNPIQLGIFAAAAKLITVAQSFIFQPLHGALFPFLSEKFAAGQQVFRQGFKKSLLLVFAATLLATLGLMLLAPFLVKLIFGEDYSEAATYVRIMAPMLVIGSLAHMSLQQGLLILRRDKVYMSIVVITGLLSIGLNLWLIPEFGIAGAAWVKLLTELSLALMAGVMFYKNLKRI